MNDVIYYIVKRIDGDYAWLQKEDEPNGELQMVALGLLPWDIMDGNRLRYEMLQYEIVG